HHQSNERIGDGRDDDDPERHAQLAKEERLGVQRGQAALGALGEEVPQEQTDDELQLVARVLEQEREHAHQHEEHRRRLQQRPHEAAEGPVEARLEVGADKRPRQTDRFRPHSHQLPGTAPQNARRSPSCICCRTLRASAICCVCTRHASSLTRVKLSMPCCASTARYSGTASPHRSFWRSVSPRNSRGTHWPGDSLTASSARLTELPHTWLRKIVSPANCRAINPAETPRSTVPRPRETATCQAMPAMAQHARKNPIA